MTDVNMNQNMSNIFASHNMIGDQYGQKFHYNHPQKINSMASNHHVGSVSAPFPNESMQDDCVSFKEGRRSGDNHGLNFEF